MSRRTDRLHAQDALERDRRQSERPGEAAVRFDPNPRSWGSRCSGWIGGVHERARHVQDDHEWRCRWCWQWFDPPAGPS